MAEIVDLTGKRQETTTQEFDDRVRNIRSLLKDLENDAGKIESVFVATVGRGTKEVITYMVGCHDNPLIILGAIDIAKADALDRFRANREFEDNPLLPETPDDA